MAEHRFTGTRGIACALFFASGALGLGYQLVWVQKASLVVGSSQIALATVLTSFFLGLGLGSLVVGQRLKSRRRSPLEIYGWFELAIGVFALAFPWLFHGVEVAYAALYSAFEASAAGVFLLRFALLFALFLVPTFFMGGTLPLLLDGLAERDERAGALASFLYGLNILGAVAGVMATAYLAIPELGMEGTSRIAGVGNLAIGAGAILVFRHAKPIHSGERAGALEGGGAGPPTGLAVLAFVSGLAAIGYQIAWARYFALFTAASVYQTAVLLGVYLTALATGSLALAPVLARRVEPLRVLALQPLVPILSLLCLDAWTLGRLELTVLDHYDVQPSWAFLSEGADAIFVAPALQTALVLFLPVVVIGTGLPSLIAAAARTRDALRPAAGSLVFWNTLGSSAGGFVAGYALIPLIGLRGTFGALALLSIALAVGAEWQRSGGARRSAAEPQLGGSGTRSFASRGRIALAVLVAAGLAATAAILSRDLVGGVIREHTTGRGLPEDELVAVEEGPLTTAYVFDGPRIRSIGAGNVRLAFASHAAASPQAFQGHLPALFHPSEEGPKTALGIALGSGQSFGALLRHPVERLDVVDISRAVTKLSLGHFGPFNNALGDDPRVHFHLDDGRHFVARTPDATYDVVSMEPPPPTHVGVYALYSLEFYREVRRVLRPGGVFMQWLPPYLVTPDDLRGMLRTLHLVFPQTLVVKSGQRDFMALAFAQDNAPVWDLSTLESRAKVLEDEPFLRGAPWRAGMRWPAASLFGVVALLVAGPADVGDIQGVVHRDDDQQLSYSSGDRQLLRRYEGDALMPVTFAALPVTPFSELVALFAQPIPVAALEEERARSLAPFGLVSPARMSASADSYWQATESSVQAARAIELAEMYHRRLALDPALGWIETALMARPTESRPELLETARRIAGRQSAVYAETFRAWLEALPAPQRASPLATAIAEEVRAQDERAAHLREQYWFD